jgi:hypothetical protein
MIDPTRTGPYQPATVDEVSTDLPQRVGRYRVERTLGEGGFGVVYLAHDDQLRRPVAVKVPHHKLVARPEDAEAYLTEARTVAGLDHPHIVPVYAAGSTGGCSLNHRARPFSRAAVASAGASDLCRRSRG